MKKAIVILFILFNCIQLVAQEKINPTQKATGKASFRQPNKKEELIVNEKKQSTPFGKQIKVLVWNIYAGVKKNVFLEVEKISQDVDLLLLQESYSGKDQDQLINETQHNWYGGNAHVHVQTGVISGVLTGTKAKASKNLVQYAKNAEPIMNVKKATLFSWYDYNNKKNDLLVVNVHAINFVTDNLFRSQINQIFEVISKHKGPIILGGDFNTFNYTKYKYVAMMVKKEGLKEVEFEQKIKKSFMGNPLDHIFVRGFKVISSEVKDAKKFSDHNPLYVTLELE